MRKLLEQAMTGDKISPLSSPLLLTAGESYAFRVPALAPGRYPFVCLPHVAGNMRGVLIVAGASGRPE
jgi:plastocyanin